MSFFGKSKGGQRDGTLNFHTLGQDAALPRTAFVALVPGAAAPLLPLDLPPGLKGQTRERVAKRQLRDIYGGTSGGTEMRPAVLTGGKQTWNRALVVAERDRQAWSAEAQAAGGLCRAVLPDYLALPAADGCWTLDTGDGVVRARLGLEDGFTAEPDLALAMLMAAYRDAPPKAVLRTGAYSPAIDGFVSEHKLKTADDPAGIAALGLARPEALAHGEVSLDLARDPGADVTEIRNSIRPYRLAAVMAVLALVCWAGSVMYELRELREQALTHRRNAEQIVRETMIPTGPILDIRAQVSKLVDQSRLSAESTTDAAQPLDVLRAAGAILSDASVRVTRVGYQPTSGLLVDLQLADFAALDDLVLTLREEGIDPKVAQSGTREDEGVEATLALALEVLRGSP